MPTAELRSLPMLERLVAFDTTSRNSNLALIDFVRDYLGGLGVDCELVHDEARDKANLYATLGPRDRAGIALSGHTDVVPVDGQSWESDPFTLTHKGERIYGRGTCDMKGFLAVCLAFAPDMVAAGLETPLHFAFSYDEEVGCRGVRSLLAELDNRALKPRACIIGEPTSMQVVRAHKGKLSARCHVRGHECHSGLTHLGVNAVEAAAECISYLKSMARRFRDRGPYDRELEPGYTTVHTGVVHGGTALNIVPKSCVFDFEFRHLPDEDPELLLSELQAYTAESLLPEMQAVDASAGFEWERLSGFPGLETAEDAEVVRLAKSLTGANRTGKVSFGTEGGLFHGVGIPAVVCGPGSIEQAHKPNEFLALDQLAACEKFMVKLIDHACTR